MQKVPRQRGKQGDGAGTPHSPWQSVAEAEGGSSLQRPVLCCDLSREETLREHRGELRKAGTLSCSKDCCDMSREMENPEQNCPLGQQEKLTLSPRAHCLPSATWTWFLHPCAGRCPRWAVFELGAESKWVLHHYWRCSVTSACHSPHFFGPDKENLSMPLLYSAPDYRSLVQRAGANHGDLL